MNDGSPPHAAESRLDALLRVASPLLLVLALAVFAAIFLDYGVTWDEGVQSSYGEQVLDYFTSLGRDTRSGEFLNLYYYGPLFESLAAAAYRLAGGFKYEIRHAAIGLSAWLTLVAVWRFGRLFRSAAVPCFALVALLTMPRFIGEAFNNSKDVPFACAFAWAMLAIARLLLRRVWRAAELLACGVAIGLALGIRVGGLVLVALFACGIAASLALFPDERGVWREHALGRGARALAVAVVAWSVMVLVWPWAQAAPLARPLAALREMSSFSFAYTTYFAGELVRSDHLPRSYLPFYLGIVTPLPTLVAATVGLAAAGVLTARRRPGAIAALLVAAWAVGPLAYGVIARPNVYDGIRHFLFVLPALALLCGLAAAWLLSHLAAGPARLAAVLTALALALPLPELVALHPYENSYFNVLVGGVGRAWRRFETDSWTSSYREAMLWVRDELRRTGGGTDVLVACNERNRPCAEAYAAGGESPAVTVHCVWEGGEPLPAGARYFVSTLRYGKAASFFPEWPVVHRIERRGAVFAVIKRNPRGP